MPAAGAAPVGWYLRGGLRHCVAWPWQLLWHLQGVGEGQATRRAWALRDRGSCCSARLLEIGRLLLGPAGNTQRARHNVRSKGTIATEIERS